MHAAAVPPEAAGIAAPTPTAAGKAVAGKAVAGKAVAVAVEGSLPVAMRLQTLSAVKMVRQLVRSPPPTFHPHPPHSTLHHIHPEYLTYMYF